MEAGAMSTIVYIDIETIPSQAWHLEVERLTFDPPANYKDPDKITAWIKNKQDEARRASQLNPLHGGEVCAIGWAFDDGQVHCHVRGSQQAELIFLEEFWDGFEQARGDEHVDMERGFEWCGHFITGFDLPFLWCRHVIQQIKPAYDLRASAKPWAPGVIDTYHQISCNGQFKGAGLKSIGKMMGFDPLEMSPEDIEAAWLADDETGLSNYCSSDVALAREIYRATKFLSPR
jgi:hypothetical protein